MKASKLILGMLGAVALAASFSAVYADNESRGELLYSTHCNACHTSEIHWRKQKLATDWNSLKVQVRRWQADIGLSWSEEEITDVVQYLNLRHYGFPIPDQKEISQEKKLNHVLRQ